MNLIEREVLARIRPESLPDEVKDAISTAQKHLPDAEVVMGGSVAKGTHLAEDYDVDIFVRFSSAERMSDRLEEGLKKGFPRVERVRGSRDYFQVPLGNYTLEFVPVLTVESSADAENVTDMSPLHVEYVRQHITDKLADGVRLLKQFCKSARVYGAESYIGGFSGYVLELLVIHAGGFQEALAAVRDWKRQAVLDPESHHADPLAAIDRSKHGPLLFVDPVQHDRNAAAAVTRDAYERLKTRAAEYLDEPREEFFMVEPLDEESFREAHPGMSVITVVLTPKEGKHDVVAAKAKSVVEHMLRELDSHDFDVKGATWEFQTERAVMLVALPAGLLEPEEIVEGPPEELAEPAKRFLEKHADAYLEEGRWYVRREREYRDPVELLNDLASQSYVVSRVASASVERA